MFIIMKKKMLKKKNIEKIPTLGSDTPMGRAGQPYEIAPLFIYLTSEDSSYVTMQVMHVNGGEYKG